MVGPDPQVGHALGPVVDDEQEADLGAAGTAAATTLPDAGVRELVAVDRTGPLQSTDDLSPHHWAIAEGCGHRLLPVAGPRRRRRRCPAT